MSFSTSSYYELRKVVNIIIQPLIASSKAMPFLQFKCAMALRMGKRRYLSGASGQAEGQLSSAPSRLAWQLQRLFHPDLTLLLLQIDPCQRTLNSSSPRMRHGSGMNLEVLPLKHERRILGQWSNPVSGSRKSQASSPWAQQHTVQPVPSWRNHIQGWMNAR